MHGKCDFLLKPVFSCFHCKCDSLKSWWCFFFFSTLPFELQLVQAVLSFSLFVCSSLCLILFIYTEKIVYLLKPHTRGCKLLFLVILLIKFSKFLFSLFYKGTHIVKCWSYWEYKWRIIPATAVMFAAANFTVTCGIKFLPTFLPYFKFTKLITFSPYFWPNVTAFLENMNLQQRIGDVWIVYWPFNHSLAVTEISILQLQW